jgi:hypothetical protein
MTARYPKTMPLSIREVRSENPSRKISTAPYILEMSTLAAIYQRVLPFPILNPHIPHVTSITQYSIHLPLVFRPDDRWPNFILVLSRRGHSLPNDLRALLVDDETSNSARRDVYVLTSFEWDDRAKTARFRMGEEAAETLRVW